MRILGIETSCDETAASVVENGTKVLSNIIASSAEMHIKTGGIIPEQAARQQVISIIPVIKEALFEGVGWSPSNNPIPKIDAIAVTVGPGLIGSLLVGVETAKTLSAIWKKPIIPVNHLVAHIYANWLDQNNKKASSKPLFPALALVVSGGHTDLVMMKDHGKINWIGGTRDDAAGEAFDKTARLLGLPYPGGPSISAAAQEFLDKDRGEKKLNLFPRPLINNKNFEWSFSGLKTSVSNYLLKNNLNKSNQQKIAAEIQEAIIDILVIKTMHAFKIHQPRSLLLAGGVAANSRLRNKFESRIKSEKLQVFHVSQNIYCTDNAAVVSSAGFFNYKPSNWRKVEAIPDLKITEKINGSRS